MAIHSLTVSPSAAPGRRCQVVSWEITAILILLAFILGMMTGIKLLKA
jgi:hypothetical protein